MGTHPIFESDFDCLTDMKLLGLLCVFAAINAAMETVNERTCKPLEYYTPHAHNYRGTLWGEKIIPYMSSHKIQESARLLLEHGFIRDKDYKAQFTYIDKNNDSIVDMDEIFTWLETISKRFAKEEFVASQMENISAFKRGQEQSEWGKPMDYETFKLYSTRFFCAENLLSIEQFDENNNYDFDWDELKTMQTWSENRVKVSSLSLTKPCTRSQFSFLTLGFSLHFCVPTSGKARPRFNEIWYMS